jgi:hypothetical protein
VLLLRLPLQLLLQRPKLLLQLLLVREETMPASPARYCLAVSWVHALLQMQQLLQVAPRMACRRRNSRQDNEMLTGVCRHANTARAQRSMTVSVSHKLHQSTT